MWKVKVKQNKVWMYFGFNDMAYALKFGEECLETGDKKTSIEIFESQDDDDDDDDNESEEY